MSVSERTIEILRNLARRPGSHDRVKADFRAPLREEFGAELSDVAFEKQAPAIQGRLDALIDRTVFEAKSDFAPPRTIGQLQIIDANSAAAHFRACRGIPLKWRGTSQFSIAGNRNASHRVNAVLSHADAVLETHIRIKAVTEGNDPTIDIMKPER